MHKKFHFPFGKLVLISVLTISFSAFFTGTSQAQIDNSYAHASLAEKIYLQLDGKVYTTDKPIWFKCIVASAADHSLTALSGVLHVELVGPDERVMEKKLIKLKDGIGSGFFDLTQTYPEGTYMVRAYTEWNKNFENDFIFKEYIQVFAPSAKAKADPITNVTIVEKQNNERRLNAQFDPLAIDSLHKKDLTLVVTIDNKKDTLSVKKNNYDMYMVDYAIPQGAQLVTLQIRTKSLASYSKTIALNQDQLDLQFFPESGELVHGLQSKVGFKALDYSGKGKSIEGEIVTEKDEVVASFKSNQFGMGSFILAKADSFHTYFAKIKSPSEKEVSIKYPLPDVAPRGNVLSVMKTGEQIRVTATSNYLKNDSVNIRISCRGQVYYNIKGALKDGALTFLISGKEFPEGILAFTMLNALMQPVAERLYFNERPESRINIALSTRQGIVQPARTDQTEH